MDQNPGPKPLTMQTDIYCITNSQNQTHTTPHPDTHQWATPSQTFRSTLLRNPNTPYHTITPKWTPPTLTDAPWHTTDPPPLLHNWKTIAYTDGSVFTLKTNQGTTTCSGAGIYYPDTNTQIGLNPNLQGSPNQINTAELVGIWGALKLGYTTIATDSACSISDQETALPPHGYAVPPLQTSHLMHSGSHCRHPSPQTHPHHQSTCTQQHHR